MKVVMQSSPLLPVQWKLKRFREMLGYGVNFQINSVVMLLFEPTTKILLGRFCELAAAGYFEMGQRLVMQARALIVGRLYLLY
jgi:O-antigen/teichoic acid export membrane protein